MRDLGLTMLPQITTAASGFIISILIARGLGPEQLGKYVLIVSLSSLVSGFSDLGINQTAIRFASRFAGNDNTDLQHSVLRWALRIRIVLAAVLFAVIYFSAAIISENFWNVEGISGLIKINLLIVFFSLFSTIPIIYFQSLKKFGKNAFVSICQTIINLAGIVTIAAFGLWTIEKVILVSIISNGLGALMFLAIVPRSIIFKFSDFKEAKKTGLKKLFKAPKDIYAGKDSIEGAEPDSFAFFMVLASVFVIITMQADVWLMGHYLDKSQVGIYNVSMKLSMPLMMFLNAFNTSLWPRSSRLIKYEETIKFLKKTIKVSFLIFLFAVLYSIAAPYMIPFMYGKDYNSSILISQLLCFRYSISILVCPVGIIGYNLGLVRKYWMINLLQLLIVVLINVILLPVIGPLASAISLIGNELTGFIITGIIIKSKINSYKKIDNGK
ncbi:MAG: oligosaccharide flippase family protein [Ignavibacteria bacterium]|nr:oligosaccharide flippase family protein [Ignavibacteria bacterium]